METANNRSCSSGFIETSSGSLADFPTPKYPIHFNKLWQRNEKFKEEDEPKKNIDLDTKSSPLNLKKHNFTMKHDLFFGWRPKVGIKHPFPLTFTDELTKVLESENHIYRGFRPSHSYRMHESFQRIDGYTFNNKSFRVYQNSEMRDLLSLHNPNDLPISNIECPQGVKFDSYFESGNCDLVIPRGCLKYDVFLRVDSNTIGHTHWFYFRVKRENKAQIKIFIRNMSKGTSIFKTCGAPYFSGDNKRWKQLKSSKYYSTNISEIGPNLRPFINRKLHTLEFDIDLVPGEWTYVAYCPPYSYSRLLQYLDSSLSSNLSSIFRRKSFCTTESLVSSPLLEISDYKNEDPLVPIESRPYIILAARVHPGETCGSHMMQGCISFLLSDHRQAVILRELFEFIVIPMLNVDGVILGNFRAGLAGDDLNRQYLDPSVELHPSIVSIIQLVKRLESEKKIAGFLDLHGHSTKPDVFSYGPELPLRDSMYEISRVFPKLIDLETEAFNFKRCTWKVHKSKRSTARAVFLKSHKIKLCYTVEASVGGYFNKENTLVPFSEKGYQEVGEGICSGLYKLVETAFDSHLLMKYLYPKYIIDQTRFEATFSRRQFTLSQVIANLQAELKESAPVSEGGSDSESEDEDIPLQAKNALKMKITKVLLSSMDFGGEKKQKNRAKRLKSKSRRKASKNRGSFHLNNNLNREGKGLQLKSENTLISPTEANQKQKKNKTKQKTLELKQEKRTTGKFRTGVTRKLSFYGGNNEIPKKLRDRSTSKHNTLIPKKGALLMITPASLDPIPKRIVDNDPSSADNGLEEQSENTKTVQLYEPILREDIYFIRGLGAGRLLDNIDRKKEPVKKLSRIAQKVNKALNIKKNEAENLNGFISQQEILTNHMVIRSILHRFKVRKQGSHIGGGYVIQPLSSQKGLDKEDQNKFSNSSYKMHATLGRRSIRSRMGDRDEKMKRLPDIYKGF